MGPIPQHRKGQKKIYFLFSVFVLTCLLYTSSAQSVSAEVEKKDVLRKYEYVIVRSNQMAIYGYDLLEVRFKLKKMTELLVANQFVQANDILEDIQKDLKTIEAKGPSYLRRERKLAWLEIFGDLVQQAAIFAIMALLLFRVSVVKSAVQSRQVSFAAAWKIALSFCVASFSCGALGLIRYGQSSWSFIDLQVLLIGLSGLVGGIWAGVLTGLANSFFRLAVVPSMNLYVVLPLAVGIFAGLVHRVRASRPLSMNDIVLSGSLIGLLHSLFIYVPIYPYLSLGSFSGAVFFLTAIEASMLVLFFEIIRQILKEEKIQGTERELYMTRLQFLQAQINPHFLFNALNTIAAVCGEEHAERARNLIIHLSTIFRRLSKEMGNQVPLNEELEYIDAYLKIEKARFGDRLKIEKDIRLSDAELNAAVPILVFQPIVENAVKHGLSKSQKGGTLLIRAEAKDGTIEFTVRDSGVGMDEERRRNLFVKKTNSNAPVSSQHAGIGLANIQERLSKMFKGQCDIKVTSIINQGTTVQITFPKI